MSPYFTKSLHKKALECPTKLYYQSRPDAYPNRNLDNAFLQALAKGGFQVGELAKVMMPGGFDLAHLDTEEALVATAKALESEAVTLYDPALRWGDFLVRVDVLVKQGSTLRLHEVKAKSFDPREDGFYNKAALKKGQHQLLSSWKPYLYDVAFQTMVARGAFPDLRVQPYLVFVDKGRVASVDGLNQRFLIREHEGRITTTVAPGTDRGTVGTSLLCTLDVHEDVERILQGATFVEEATAWAAAWLEGEKIAPKLSKACRDCEFRTKGPGLSGFDECWQESIKRQPVKGELVIDLWNFRRTDDLIAEGRLLLSEVTQEDVRWEAGTAGGGMSIAERQWHQVEKVSRRSPMPVIDDIWLRRAQQSWTWPLHCIDFETTMVALPFHAGRRPYEQIAFQFSHHTIDRQGEVKHVGEFLHAVRGQFPNFDFVRALKQQLETDAGTIFRYSNHENTVLCQIHEQLRVSQEADREELMAFIRTITVSTQGEGWTGARAMFDLWELVKKAYYHPRTMGSNSIKQVLPAVLHESAFLREKYAQPIYGTKGGIPSCNFREYAWLQYDAAGSLIDPYKQLPPIFAGIDPEVLEGFMMDGDELAEGGTAMMAFARMQFSEMSDLERQRIRAALLRYCELDTLAMVMIIEHVLELLGQRPKAREAHAHGFLMVRD